jgi:hypothetical protein
LPKDVAQRLPFLPVKKPFQKRKPISLGTINTYSYHTYFCIFF